MADNKINVGGRLHSIATGNILAGADEILDDNKGKKQSEVNIDVDNALANRYTKDETYNKNQLNNLITTPNQEYVTVEDYASLPESGKADTIYRVSNWDGSLATPATDITKYSEYAWNGTEYVFLSVKSQIGEVFDISEYNSGAIYTNLADALGNNGINVPSFIRRGGMSVKFKCVITPAKYTVVKTEGASEQPTGAEIQSDPGIISGTYTASELSAFSTLPTTLNSPLTYYLAVTETVDKQEVTTYTTWVIIYAQSSDNKYVQYRLIANEFTTDTTQWAITDEGIYVENPEFVYVKTDKNNKILWAIRTDGSIYYGAGVPPQIIDYINEKIAELSLDEYDDIVAFLNGLEKGDKTLQELLNEKVDKEEGKSLIPTRYIQENENPEYLELSIDKSGKILYGVTKNGDVYFGKGVPTQIKEYVKNIRQKQNEELSKRYVKSSATLDIGSILHARSYTLQYFDDACAEFQRAGMPFVRAYASPLSDIEHHNLTTYDAYKRGIEILAISPGTDSENVRIEDLSDKVAWYINTYDGNLHDYLLYYEDGVAKNVGIKIIYWNFFNEPDRNSYWVENKLELLNRMRIIYTTIKGLRPECKIVFGGFSSFSYNNFFEDFSEVRDADGKAFWDYCDIIGYHLYSTNYTWLENEFNLFKSVANRKYSINEYSHLIDKPVWVIECGTIPFTEANIEENRKNYLPKSILHLLSYGVERVLMYRLVEYNMFVNQSSAQCYFGLTSPQFNCAWAGFHYNDSDKTSLTPDNLLDKTYIYSDEGQILNAVYLPHLTLSEMSKSGIMSKGIEVSGDGFTLKKLVIGDFTNGNVVEKRVLWTGSNVMNGANYVEIAGSAFEDADFEYQLIAEIENITMSDISVDRFVHKDSYYSIKFLASLLNCVAEQPSVIDKGLYSIAKIKQYDGTCVFALWSNFSNVSVSIETSENATFWDVKGNNIDGDITVLTSSPIYITNVYGINVIANN